MKPWMKKILWDVAWQLVATLHHRRFGLENVVTSSHQETMSIKNMANMSWTWDFKLKPPGWSSANGWLKKHKTFPNKKCSLSSFSKDRAELWLWLGWLGPTTSTWKNVEKHLNPNPGATDSAVLNSATHHPAWDSFKSKPGPSFSVSPSFTSQFFEQTLSRKTWW